jgi:thioredoxin 1
MASSGAEAAGAPAAAAPAPVAPAEGSVITINSLEEWSIQIDEANSKKKLVPVSSFLCFYCR